MPEIITIFFNCTTGGMSYDPLLSDAVDRCYDVKESLIDFLDDHNVSYYRQYVKNDEYYEAERKLIELGIRERGG